MRYTSTRQVLCINVENKAQNLASLSIKNDWKVCFKGSFQLYTHAITTVDFFVFGGHSYLSYGSIDAPLSGSGTRCNRS